MADEFRLEINTEEVIERFGRRIPDLCRQNVLEAVRQFMGKLDDRVQQNIATMFDHSPREYQPEHLKLADSMLATVRQEGDLIIGEYGYDLEETPWARILEMGGSISAHTITPSSAGALKIPISTFASGEAYEQTRQDETGLFVISFGASHPGAHIQAYHYILTAITDLAREFENDLQLAVIASFVQA